MKCLPLLPLLTGISFTIFFLCGFTGISGSGNQVILPQDIIDFHSISTGHDCRSTITKGDSFSVIVRIDDNLTDYLVVKNDNGTLVIELDRKSSYRNVHFEADIVMPDINKVEASGGSRGYINGFSFTHTFSIVLSGGSSLEGEISTGDIETRLSGGSVLGISGYANNMDFSASGGSKGQMAGFSVNNIDVLLSGGSKLRINANGIIMGSLSGGSELLYSGGASVTHVTTSGGASISEVN